MKLFRNLTRQQKVALGMLILLLVSLPVGLYLARVVQDIRPRADITSQANFLLTSSKENPGKGESFIVTAKLDLESSGLRVSGVDFRILYDKTLLEPNPTIIEAIGEGKPFTNTLVKEVDKPYSDQFNYLRVVMVARKTTPELAGGEVELAKITFKAKNTDGTAIIKYPPEEKDANGVDIMQVSGIDLGSGGPTSTPTPTTNPSVSPTVTVTPTIIPSVTATRTPTPTPTNGPTVSPTPTEPPEVQAGLVGHWRMNEISGAIVRDAKGNHDGTAFEASIVDGLRGEKARSFDGINDYIKVPIANSLKPASVSVSLWFKGTKRDGYLFTTATSATEFKGYTLRSATTVYTMAFILKVPGTPNSTILAQINDTSIFDGEWHHVVGTYDKSNVKLYIDGQLKDSKPSSAAIEYGTSDLYMGSIRGTSRFFKGVIDQVRFYNRALSQSDVTKLYQIKK